MNCTNKIKMYGAPQKIQRANYTLVPAGSEGKIIHTYKDQYGTEVSLVKFKVDGKQLFVRTKPELLELSWTAAFARNPQ